VPEEEFLHLCRVNARPLKRSTGSDRPELRRMEIFEGPAVFAYRRAGGTKDDNVCDRHNLPIIAGAVVEAMSGGPS
jgi:hypothetical protein